jgi:hypothetical protein
MTVTLSEPAPIACTLGPANFQQRVAWIANLNRDALRVQRRDGLRLELTYAPSALNRVREMVAREEDCCAFLTFELQQGADTVRLIIEAPEHARDALDAVFDPFQAREPAATVCGCSSAGCYGPER